MNESAGERLVEDPIRRQRFRFSRDRNVLRLEVWTDSGGDVPPHFHPAQEERFEVLAGDVKFVVDGTAMLAGAGDRAVAKPGVPHSFENVGSEEAHLRVEVEPAGDMQEFLEEAARLARAGKYTRHGFPRGPRAAIEMAVFAEDYRDTTVVLSPPRFVQRVFLAPLARFGRRRGLGKSR
jgi:quercetin dioxygenase-like cupin family protein